jgi:hypothetical protein
MKARLLAGAVALAMISGSAQAGCVGGAVVGGVAGHMAGHHAGLGAVGGCAVGHHMAKKKQQRAMAAHH